LEEAVTTTTVGVGGENEERSYRSYPLSLEGSLVSLSSLHEERGLFLASYRPSTRVPCVRHLCTQLTATQADSEAEEPQPHGYDCKSVVSLFGGSQMRMLSRARLFRQEKSGPEFSPYFFFINPVSSEKPPVICHLSRFHDEFVRKLLVASGDDDAGGGLVWNCTAGSRIQSLPIAGSAGPVIDVCAFNKGENLGLLTNHQVDVFKWSQNYGGDT
uniref:WD_REPEATS_REGION domain-containing protein n=1 Tax=Hydatigena taeniaeformis TaxID=6205 RepID=A0A0R3X8A3_HYDTA